MKLSKELVRIMQSANNKKTSGYDTEATVTRIDGDTAWVHIPDGVDETPVRLTIDAKQGDSVQVRVSDGDAFLIGNGTAPPTDDTTANIANRTAQTAENNSVIAMNEADKAKQAADQAVADSIRAREAAENAESSAEEAATSASNASASASSAQASATSAQQSATTAGQNASMAQAASEAAQLAALATITTDTLHYLATNLDSGVTTSTSGWTTTIQTITSTNRYLWTYHTYTSANGTTTDTTPVITGAYGQDGTSVTILGSYNTLAELQQAHPTGSLGDAYMVAGDLYVWNGSAWEDVGQIQGPQGPQGIQGETGDDGVSVTSVQPQYYLSTSSSSATGGSWSTTLSYVVGKYIWTRDWITYSDSSTSHSQEIYNEALTQSCEDAAEALGLIQEQQEYFWHDSLGAHVLGDTSGYRNDITSTGMKIVDASSEMSVAEFGTDARIGRIDAPHVEINSTEIGFYDGISAESVAHISNNELEITSARLGTELRIGNFAWVLRNPNRISFIYMPEE